MTVEICAGAGYGLMLLVGSILGVGVWRRERVYPGRWCKRSRRLIGRPLSGADAFTLSVWVLFMALAGGVVLYAMGAREDNLSLRDVVVQSVAVHWMILLGVGVLVRVRGTPLRRIFGMHRGRTGGDLRRGALAYLVTMPIVFVYALIYRLLLQMLDVDLTMQDVAQVLTGDAAPAVRAYLLFLGVFLGPLAEEVLFRGVLFPVLARKVGVLGSMVLVSALFAGIHAHVPSLLPLFVLSISLCVAYTYVGSIVAPVVMHMLFNAVNLVLVFLVHNP